MDDTLIFDAAQALLVCAWDGLATTSYQPPDRAYVNVGEPAHDNCCDGQGQLTVTIPRRWRSSPPLPDPDTAVTACGQSIPAFEFRVELVRCWPMNDDNADPPGVDVLTEAARQQMVEARAIYTAIECCLYARRDGWESRLGEQSDVGPLGGCAGSLLSGIVAIFDPSVT